MIYESYGVDLKPRKKAYLVFFSDVHYNVEESDKEKFRAMIGTAARWKRLGHAVMLFGLGDYNDSMSTSERSALSTLHDFTLDALDKWAEGISDTFYKALSPVRGSFIGLCEGHHYMRFQGNGHRLRNSTNTKYLCEKLGTTYFGTCGYVTLKFPHGLAWEFIGHHGRGAAQTRNARILKRKRFGEAFPRANAVVMGHDHDLFAEPDQGIGLDSDGTFPIKRWYVASGSYLRGYILGRETGTYVEQAAYKPGQLGSPVFEFEIVKTARGHKIVERAFEI